MSNLNKKEKRALFVFAFAAAVISAGGNHDAF
jgi:hypothetical protein